MEWRDQGLIIGVRKHGETSVIVEAMTLSHGRQRLAHAIDETSDISDVQNRKSWRDFAKDDMLALIDSEWVFRSDDAARSENALVHFFTALSAR